MNLAPTRLSEPDEPAPFLGVERSVTGKFWRQRASDERMALAISQRLQVPEPVGRLLASRGQTLDTAESFLSPRLRDLLPDPSSFRDMDAAAERVAAAIERGEKIAIFGDYDVDGATSAALLSRFLRAAGALPVRLYVPDRGLEGYGPNAPALLQLKSEGAGLVITVDCGVTAFAPLQVAKEAGLDVVVVDHHVAEPHLPLASAVVNPNRLDETAGHGQMAAIGVAFLLAVAVNRRLRIKGWYNAERPEPDMMQWLDLVALGTVCDVVPLTGVNRALVAQGLKVLAQRRNPGLRALSEVAGISERAGAYHLGFLLGPRINAGGRVGRSDLGARLLSTDDPSEAIVQLGGTDVRRSLTPLLMLRLLSHLQRRARGPSDGPQGVEMHDTATAPTYQNVSLRNRSASTPCCLIQVDDTPTQVKLGFYEELARGGHA